MLQTKTFELRDKATFIPIVAVRCDAGSGDISEVDRWLLRRAGYGAEFPCVLLTRLEGRAKAHCDEYDWGDRTFTVAHEYIAKNWDTLHSGDVVDVEYILGERPSPKTSERMSTEVGL
jgi:hypothetical protein